MRSKNDETPTAPTDEVSESTNPAKVIDMQTNVANKIADFTIFKFGENEIRVIDKSGEPWFVAADVCRALELGNPTKAIKNLDEDEVAITSIQGLSRGNDKANIVSESGMYTLVLRCRDAVIKGTVPYQFRKWVTAEVLPSIRKTGMYEKTRKTTVNERTPLRDAVNMLVGKKGLRYDDAYNMVHQRFNVDSIDELELSQIPEAVEYIHRVVLDGEYLGKQKELPKPDLTIDYPLEWFQQNSGYTGFKNMKVDSSRVMMTQDMLVEGPSAALRLLNYLRDNGFDITAPYVEVQSLRHIMLDMRRTLNCIQQDVARASNKAMTFRT